MRPTDKKILKLLQDDASMPFAEIAAKVHLSAAPCWRRIQKLKDAGVIRKQVALCDAKNSRSADETGVISSSSLSKASISSGFTDARKSSGHVRRVAQQDKHLGGVLEERFAHLHRLGVGLEVVIAIGQR